MAKQQQTNAQDIEERYNLYVAAAITGILAANPNLRPDLVATRANEVAKQAVFEQRRQMQQADYGYVNLY